MPLSPRSDCPRASPRILVRKGRGNGIELHGRVLGSFPPKVTLCRRDRADNKKWRPLSLPLLAISLLSQEQKRLQIKCRLLEFEAPQPQSHQQQQHQPNIQEGLSNLC